MCPESSRSHMPSVPSANVPTVVAVLGRYQTDKTILDVSSVSSATVGTAVLSIQQSFANHRCALR